MEAVHGQASCSIFQIPFSSARKVYPLPAHCTSRLLPQNVFQRAKIDTKTNQIQDTNAQQLSSDGKGIGKICGGKNSPQTRQNVASLQYGFLAHRDKSMTKILLVSLSYKPASIPQSVAVCIRKRCPWPNLGSKG